ncbi:unnamed protein product [Chrysoparadoxa australica]
MHEVQAGALNSGPLFPKPRPFRVLGLQQVAIGGLDHHALSHLWTDLLGVPRVGQYYSEKENVDEVILSLGRSPHAVEIDLMQPIDPEGHPNVHSKALHHIGLWVDQLELACHWLQDQGVKLTPGGIRPGAAGHDVAFIHPKGGGEGVLIELVQAPPDIIEAHRDDELQR